jgi:outer membrane autotransporter protein
MAQTAALDLSNSAASVVRLAKILVAELKAIRIVEKGGTPPDALTSVFWGSWSSVLKAAAAIGDSPLNILYNFAYTTYADLQTTEFEADRARLGIPFAKEEPSGFPNDIALAYASVLRSQYPVKPAFQPRWAFWVTALGGYGRANGDPASGVPTLTSRAFGSTVGAEYQFSPNTKAGIALSGTGSTWGDAAGGSGASNAVNVNLYGAMRQDRVYISGWLNANDNWINTTRFTGGDEVVGKFAAQSYGARLEGGYRYPVAGTFGVTPYAGLQVQLVHLPAYNEIDLAGGGMGFNYSAMDGTDTRSELGTRFDTTQTVSAGTVTWTARAAWAHDWLNNFGVGSVFQAVPTTTFVANGATLLPEDSALLTLEAKLALASKWSIAAKFDSQLADGFQTYAGIATLRYVW